MDEPLSNLDALLRASMRAEIKTLHQELATTTLYVTHDQIEAMSLATAIAVMKDGRVEQYGPPSEIYSRPASLFVGRFVGSPSINVLPVQLYREGGILWLAAENVRIPVPPASIFDSSRFPPDGNILLGIRPEHFAPASADMQGIRGTVRLVEPLGQDQYLHVAVGDTTLIVRTSPDRDYTLGEAIGLVPMAMRMHFFDPRTEKRI
jgi:multiple sugar transport system ATP-binding protein